jgi:hypothetical protein
VEGCGLVVSGTGWPVAGSCEHGCEPSGSVKAGKFLYQLSVTLCKLLKKDSASWSYLIEGKQQNVEDGIARIVMAFTYSFLLR